MSRIVLDHVSRWYGQVIALSDISLELPAGITGLLGDNGAGKSTLLKLVTGQLRPSRGRLRILGRDPLAEPSVLRGIGYSPEHEGAYEELTGLEFVALMTELHGIPRAEALRRARATLERLDLADAMSRPIGSYSKGMRQRAKIAQALAHEPEVLILDEPLTGCDPLAKTQVMDAIREFGRKDATILVSSHVLAEVEALTSRIVLIHKGRLVAQGDVFQIRGLIDKHPHRIRVVCDRPRALGEVLVALDAVHGLTFLPDAVEVETRSPDECYPAIPEAAELARVRIASLTSPDDNMAAVFRYLTEEHA